MMTGNSIERMRVRTSRHTAMVEALAAELHLKRLTSAASIAREARKHAIDKQDRKHGQRR
jgi:hypothetical protein